MNADGGDQIAAAAGAATLPATVVLNPGVQVITSVDEPGMLEAVARVCSTPLSGADLVAVATTIAAAIYADPSHEQLAVLVVSSWTPDDGTEYLEQVATITAANYQNYLWDNTTGALKAAWQ